jgi:glycosyltransferase involved in cell wall biosynthesis
MKLLFVLPEYPPYSGGGIATFYKNTLPELAKQGHQVHVLVGSAFTSKLSSYEENGVTIDFLDTEALSLNLVRFNNYHAVPELQRHLAAAWTAWEQVKGGQGYDLVETTDWGLLFIPWVASPESPPAVVQLHGSVGQIDFYDPQHDSYLQGSFLRLLESGLLAVADELQTYSRSNAQAWSQLSGRSVTYIPPALQPASTPEPLVKSAEGLVVGRIQYWKGPTVLCEALRLLGKRAPALDWIGRDTVYRESSASMAAHLTHTYPDIWGVKVRPLGTLLPEETAKLQAKAQFIGVPSTWDVFNYTCAEGMAQAQTVLCSQGAGAADLIENGVNGLTFPADNPQALAESLDTLLSLSTEKRRQMGQAGQQIVQSKLNPNQIVQQRIEAYEKLLSRGKFPVRPNAWLLDAVSPNQPLDKPLSFLNRLPLRELSQYVLERGLKKLVS